MKHLRSQLFDAFKKIYADTARIRRNQVFIYLRRDNAEESISNAMKNRLFEKVIRSEKSTAFEPWQNYQAEIQIWVLCNIARTNDGARALPYISIMQLDSCPTLQISPTCSTDPT